jgi:hypothetical protein
VSNLLYATAAIIALVAMVQQAIEMHVSGLFENVASEKVTGEV